MSTRRRIAPVPVLLAAALVLAGCAGDDDAEPAASTGSIATETAAPSGNSGEGGGGGADEGDASPFPSDAGPDEQAASGDSLVTLTDIRTGRHDGYDRVVFEVEGEGRPGWDVRYVDEPTEQGSGNPVDVSGDAVLQVTVTGVGYPFDTGVEQFEPGGPVSGPGTSVTEVVLGPTFEGTTEAFVGTTGESPFRVYLLEGPTRIVVEVADAT